MTEENNEICVQFVQCAGRDSKRTPPHIHKLRRVVISAGLSMAFFSDRSVCTFMKEVNLLERHVLFLVLFLFGGYAYE
jgi:hypothetical protein